MLRPRAGHRRTHAGRLVKIVPNSQVLRARRRGLALCEWHRGDMAIDWTIGGAGCPDCGNLLADRRCQNCGQDFLDWSAKGYDDIVSAPAVCEYGDLTCVRCLRSRHDHDTEAWEEDGDYSYAEDDDWADLEEWQPPLPTAGHDERRA